MRSDFSFKTNETPVIAGIGEQLKDQSIYWQGVPKYITIDIRQNSDISGLDCTLVSKCSNLSQSKNCVAKFRSEPRELSKLKISPNHEPCAKNLRVTIWSGSSFFKHSATVAA